jgi:hypothetical protein
MITGFTFFSQIFLLINLFFHKKEKKKFIKIKKF